MSSTISMAAVTRPSLSRTGDDTTRKFRTPSPEGVSVTDSWTCPSRRVMAVGHQGQISSRGGSLKARWQTGLCAASISGYQVRIWRFRARISMSGLMREMPIPTLSMTLRYLSSEAARASSARLRSAISSVSCRFFICSSAVRISTSCSSRSRACFRSPSVLFVSVMSRIMACLDRVPSGLVIGVLTMEYQRLSFGLWISQCTVSPAKTRSLMHHGQTSSRSWRAL